MALLNKKLKRISFLFFASFLVISPVFSDNHSKYNNKEASYMMEEKDEINYEREQKNKGYKERKAYGYYNERAYFVMPLGYIMNASSKMCPRLFKPVECKVTLKNSEGDLVSFEVKGNNRCEVANTIKEKYIDNNFEFVSARCRYELMESFDTRKPIKKNQTIMCPQVYSPVVCEVRLVKGEKEIEYELNASNKCFARVEIMNRFPGYAIKEMRCEPIKEDFEEEIRPKYKSKNEILEEIIRIKSKIKYVDDPFERERLFRKLRFLEIELREKINKRNESFFEEKRMIANEKIRELMAKKEEIKSNLFEKEKEIRERVKELKERIRKKIREGKRLGMEDKEEIISLIKEMLYIRLEKTQVEILELLERLNSEEEELMKLLQSLENESVINEVNIDFNTQLEVLLADIEELKEKLNNTTTVFELKNLVKSYLEIKIKLRTLKEDLKISIKQNLNVNSTKSNN